MCARACVSFDGASCSGSFLTVSGTSPINSVMIATAWNRRIYQKSPERLPHTWSELFLWMHTRWLLHFPLPPLLPLMLLSMLEPLLPLLLFNSCRMGCLQ